jgi:hypothetical protein
MTLSMVAVVVLLLGLLFYYLGTGPANGRSGSGTLAELGRSMIWVGVFFVVAGMINHGQLVLTR